MGCSSNCRYPKIFLCSLLPSSLTLSTARVSTLAISMDIYENDIYNVAVYNCSRAVIARKRYYNIFGDCDYYDDDDGDDGDNR